MTKREAELRIRENNVRMARCMNRLGGGDLTPEQAAIFDRYVKGELDNEDLLRIGGEMAAEAAAGSNP